MTIRTFQPGDEEAQAAIYNEAARRLPAFKPASADEVRRRQRSPSFDAHIRFFALDGDRPIGYAVLNRNGRVSYPWVLPGFEAQRAALFDAVEYAARQAGLIRMFAAYRADWPDQAAFFAQRGFIRARDMINFVLDVVDFPTQTVHVGLPQRRMRREDVPALQQLGGRLFAGLSSAELAQKLFSNPWFPAESLFVLHKRDSETPLAFAALIQESGYADPHKVDAAMPCYRLGAFGNETQDVKRIRGMFSFLVAPGQNTNLVGLDLLGHVAQMLQDDVESIAAQIGSDQPELAAFYKSYFRRQGSFPVFERELK